MLHFPPTIILRHRKENLKKCSLRGLENREDFIFFTYPKDNLPDLMGYIFLTPEAPPLAPEDGGCGLFLVDGTWRYAEKMVKSLPNPRQFVSRSIPEGFQTAYPRSQEGWINPEKGLASIEALFIAYALTGRETKGLLDHYYWKGDFLKKNQKSFDFSIGIE